MFHQGIEFHNVESLEYSGLSPDLLHPNKIGMLEIAEKLSVYIKLFNQMEVKLRI